MKQEEAPPPVCDMPIACPYCRDEVRVDALRMVDECPACEMEIIIDSLDWRGRAYGSA